MQDRIMVFIPAYNCERQISRVLAQFTPDIQGRFAEIVVIDNRSKDKTRKMATAAMQDIKGVPVTLLQNDQNYGLGGSHKVAFRYALAKNYDYCIGLHGDDQGDIRDILPELERGTHRQYDCIMGARFMPGSWLKGYSRFRTFGNLVFNGLFSLATLRAQWDLGACLGCYSRAFLQTKFYMKLSDDLTMSYRLQLYVAANRVSQRFFPISWREDDQVSNVRLMRQALQVLGLLAGYVFRRSTLLAERSVADFNYKSSVVATNGLSDQ